MADGLAEALLGLNVPASQSPYAVGQQAIAQVTPNLITPYTSTGKAIGLSLGSVLLQSLLAYQARSSALQDTLQANSLANQMLKMQTPEERTAFIAQQDVSPIIGSRLSTLATALTAQERARQAKADEKLLEMTAAYKAQLTPEGTEVFEREQTSLLNRALQQAAASRQPRDQQLPAGVQERIVDASTFAEAAQAHRDKIAKMSPAELKTLLTTGTSMFGLLGDSGFVPENEAVVQLYRKANFGATLTGQEKKAADIITGKTFTASKADILSAWDTLINLSNKRAQRTIEVATQSPSTVSEMLNKPPAAQVQSPDDARKEQLRKQIAEMKALLAQRQK